MERFLRCSDNVVLAVISTPGVALRLEERPVTVVGRMISLSSKEVRACFDLTVPQITRARSVALALKAHPDAFDALAGIVGGENRTDAPQYKTLMRLLEIGERITDPAIIEHFAKLDLTLEVLHFASQSPDFQVMRAWERTTRNYLKPRKRQPAPHGAR